MHVFDGALGLLLALQATVHGTVRDGETGAPLAGVTVALTDVDRVTSTDSDGRYVLAGAPAGPQHLTARFIGYASRSLHALVPGEGRIEINITLHRIPVRLPALEVRAAVIIRGADGRDELAAPDRSVSIAAVRNHPLLAEPDALLALGGGDVVMRPESPSGVSVRGGASDQVAYLLDGIPIFSPYHAAGVFSAWNPDALSRLEMHSSLPAPSHPDALSGTVEAVTRAPGDAARVLGSASTTQARLTLDGPLGRGTAGYLASIRSSFPGAIAPRDDHSYVRGETGDWLAKVESPMSGGHLRVLGYGSENNVGAAADGPASDAPGDVPARNGFEWHGRSLGAEWTREYRRAELRVLAWSAAGDAGSTWRGRTGDVSLASMRRDAGLLVETGARTSSAATTGGVRLERSTTSYAVLGDAAAPMRMRARTPVASVFGRHTRRLGESLELDAAMRIAAAARGVQAGPRAAVRVRASPAWSLSGSYARSHQFAQSLRNPESVVSNLFPADLYLGAGHPRVPVARSDQTTLGADYRPTAGVRLGVQGWVRRLDGLVHVAPRDGGPFSLGAFVTGSGGARGVSVDASVSGARFAAIGSYGLQRVRLTYGDSGYVPEHGGAHQLEGGLIVFPTLTTSVRLGASAVMGRRATAAAGGFEWESCNLLDRGCEFAGSPDHTGERLGASRLPAYARVDLGVRKHWHPVIGGRDVLLAAFGTVTNVFGRANVLTWMRSPSTGELTAIEMRPLAPLVVGLDWRF